MRLLQCVDISCYRSGKSPTANVFLFSLPRPLQVYVGRRRVWPSDSAATEPRAPITPQDLWKHAPQPAQIGVNDMKVLPINAHLFTILHLKRPTTGSIKVQPAHRGMSQEKITRVRRG